MAFTPCTLKYPPIPGIDTLCEPLMGSLSAVILDIKMFLPRRNLNSIDGRGGGSGFEMGLGFAA